MARVTHSPAHGADYVMPVLGAAFSLEEAVEDALDSGEDLTVGDVNFGDNGITIWKNSTGYLESPSAEGWLFWEGATADAAVTQINTVANNQRGLNVIGNGTGQSGVLAVFDPVKTASDVVFIDADGKLQFGATGGISGDVTIDRTGAGTLTVTGATTVTGAVTATGVVNAPNVGSLFATLTADSASLANDATPNTAHLTVTLPAAGTYALEAMVIYTTDATADFQVQFAGGATVTATVGTSDIYYWSGPLIGGDATTPTVKPVLLPTSWTTAFPITTTGAPTAFPTLFKGKLVATAAGTITLAAAQGTSDAFATLLKAGSYLKLDRVA